jgi:hypothetical protein
MQHWPAVFLKGSKQPHMDAMHQTTRQEDQACGTAADGM